MTVTGTKGTTYNLDPAPIGSGGEGDVYGVTGTDKVAKIYKAGALSAELEEKLKIMIARPPNASVLTQVAWPLDMVCDGGHCLGFTMPKLSINAELGDVYKYPSALPVSAQQKINIARNICAVISEVHKAGYVFGDFNPRNIGLDVNTGLVSFLDTDTYHVVNKAGDKVYRCNVCAPGYAAPELLKKCSDYVSTNPAASKNAYALTPLPTFTKETDNFALAIHIFKLLMNGYTPFGGIIETASVSQSSPGVGDAAVRRDSYCFKPGYKHQSAAIMPLEALPQEIAGLFTRAFILGRSDPRQRPGAAEWHGALVKYEQSLVTCPDNRLHQYDRKNSVCPLCEADRRFMAAVQESAPAEPSLRQSVYAPPPTVASGRITAPGTIKPVMPVKSVMPAKPVIPLTPSAPVTPVKQAAAHGKKKSPAALWLLLPLITACVVISILYFMFGRDTPRGNSVGSGVETLTSAPDTSSENPVDGGEHIDSPEVNSPTESELTSPTASDTPSAPVTDVGEPSPSTTENEETSPTLSPPYSDNRLSSAFEAYSDVLSSAINTYGVSRVDDEWAGVINACLVDFDNDGVPELVIKVVVDGSDSNWTQVTSVYGYSGDTQILLFEHYGDGIEAKEYSGRDDRSYLRLSQNISVAEDDSSQVTVIRKEDYYTIDNGEWISALTRTRVADGSLPEWTVNDRLVSEDDYNNAPSAYLGITDDYWIDYWEGWGNSGNTPSGLEGFIDKLRP